MARNVYYNHEIEAHKNLFHKQFPIKVYYFMDYAVNMPKIFNPKREWGDFYVDPPLRARPVVFLWNLYFYNEPFGYDTVGWRVKSV